MVHPIINFKIIPLGVQEYFNRHPNNNFKLDKKYNSLSKIKVISKYRIQAQEKLKIKHSFSHYNLDIDSLILKFESESSKKLVNNQTWFNVSDLKSIGTPAPVSKIIEKVI